MRRGFTLVELLVVMAALAIVAALAIPSAIAARDRGLVALHAEHLAAAHADTRLSARLAGARAELVVTAGSYQLRRLEAGSLVPVWTRPGPDRDGLTLSGPATPMVFDSRGFMLGAGNRTYILSRGAATRRVVISRLGRLRILP